MLPSGNIHLFSLVRELTMQLKIESRPDHLLAVVTGTFDKSQLSDHLKEIFTASARQGLRKILIDIRNLEGEIDLLARFDAGQLVADLQQEPVRLTILGTQEQLWPDRFFENVANNRGVRTKVSIDGAEALAWLHQDTVVKSTGSVAV